MLLTSQPSTSPITLTAVTKRFGSLAALKSIDLAVTAGERIAIVGRSGAGKSTLLQVINGQLQPTTGQVEVLGHNPALLSARQLARLRRDIGYIYQALHLVGQLTCLENVLIGSLGRLRGPRLGVRTYPKHERRLAMDYLDRVGLADQAGQQANTLSGGQQQRTAIARALLQAPDILLADEPVSSLDLVTASEILELFRHLATERNLTVVASMHQADLAQSWATRIIGLSEGRMVLDRDQHSAEASSDVLAVYD